MIDTTTTTTMTTNTTPATAGPNTGETKLSDTDLTALGLTRMAKIEVVVDGDDVPAVRELFLAAGATGYTAVSGVSGFGHHGHHQGRLLFNDRASLSLLISVVPIDRVESVIAGVRRLLEDHHGVFFVSETHVSRPTYFA